MSTVPASRRILFVSFLEPWSIGPEKGAPSLYETLAGYARAGWAVDYVTFRKRPLLGVAHERSVDVNVEGVTVHRFGIPRWRWMPARVQAKLDRLLLFPLLALPTTLRLLRRRRPDVLYGYEASGIITAALTRLLRRKRELRVHRIQGVFVYDKHKRVLHMLRKMEEFLALLLPADAYIMTNDGTKGDEVWQYWNHTATSDRLLHIRNGIGAALMAPKMDRGTALQHLGLDPAYRYILMLSRLNPLKRIDRGIHAMARLRDSHPQARLVIVGDGEHRTALEALADDLGISDRVIFLGALDRPSVAIALSGADIFLSLYDLSNCGNPLFEGLIHKLPVVTLDNGATGTVVTDGVNGRLLPVDDRDALHDALAILIDDPNSRDHLARGAGKWANENLVPWTERMNRELAWLLPKLTR